VGKSTPIIQETTVTVGDKRFRFDFGHRGGAGYYVTVTPFAQNRKPGAPENELIMVGEEGMRQTRIHPCPRYYRQGANQLQEKAVYTMAVVIAHLMCRFYGLKFKYGTPAAVLGNIDGVEAGLLQKTVDKYFPCEVAN